MIGIDWNNSAPRLVDGFNENKLSEGKNQYISMNIVITIIKQ
jgi:hypothetical protein